MDLLLVGVHHVPHCLISLEGNTIVDCVAVLCVTRVHIFFYMKLHVRIKIVGIYV